MLDNGFDIGIEFLATYGRRTCFVCVPRKKWTPSDVLQPLTCALTVLCARVRSFAAREKLLVSKTATKTSQLTDAEIDNPLSRLSPYEIQFYRD
jgi:hypothetical protein